MTVAGAIIRLRLTHCWFSWIVECAVSLEPKSLSECFDEGAGARAARKALNTNPYAAGTEERREWAAGWSATCDLDEDDDPLSSRVDVNKDTLE